MNCAPVVRAEHQPGGGAPIVGEVEAVDADVDLLVDDRQIPLVEDAVEQRVHEIRTALHVHHQRRHAADAPTALEEHHAQLAEDKRPVAPAVGQRARLIEAALTKRIGKLIRVQLVRTVSQRVRHRVRHARAPVPDAAKLVHVQLAGRVQVGVNGAAAGGQVELFDLAGPRVVVEVGADLDHVVAEEIGDFFAVFQPIMVANLVVDHRDRVKIERHIVSLFVPDRR